VLALAAVLMPALAHADVVTPLMMATSLHLFIGNALIGIGEGILIAFIFKARILRAILWMVAANYFSAWIGWAGLLGAGSALRPDIYSVQTLLGWAIVASFTATILLEWPFIWLALKGRTHRSKAALLASLIAQTASYAVIVPLYYSTSDVSLCAKTHLERSLAFVKNKDAVVYYIVPEGGALARMHLDGSSGETLMAIDPGYFQLFTRKAQDSGMSDLCLVKGPIGSRDEKVVLPAFAPTAAVAEDEDYQTRDHLYRVPALDLRPEKDREWEFLTYDAFQAPLVAFGKSKGESLSLVVESPFLTWRVSNVTVLPNDEVLFQLDDQIVILDRTSMKLALITRGYSPMVVLDRGAGAPSGKPPESLPLTDTKDNT